MSGRDGLVPKHSGEPLLGAEERFLDGSDRSDKGGQNQQRNKGDLPYVAKALTKSLSEVAIGLRSKVGGGKGGQEGMDFAARMAKSLRVDKTYAPVESLDYDISENEVYRAEQASRTPLDTFIYDTLKWGLCLLTAVVVAAFGILVNVGVENLAGAKFSWTLSIMEESYLLSFCVYAGINCLLVGIACSLVVFMGPAAAGSGIPDVKAYLNGIDAPGVLHFRTLVTKVLGCICSVAGGLAVGKEGPFVHLGSCVASLFTHGGLPGFRLRNKWMQMLDNDRDQRDMVTCGGVAGVAAAFRAPVGGVLFALEEASSWWSNQVLWRAFFTTAVVSVSLRMMMKLCGGNNCGYFGSGGYIIFEISQGQVDYQLMELFPMLLLGLLGGILGSTFNSLSAQLCLWRRDVLHKRGPWWRVGEAVTVAFIGSLVTFVLPLAAPCSECPVNIAAACPRTSDADFGSYISFNCARPTEYNELATLFFNTQDNAIRALFSSKSDHEYSVFALTTFFFFFYFLAILTYGVSVPSGLFVPSILCGAAYGRLVGMVMTELNGNKDIDEGTYALLGAASFLGGAMRMTVSLCVILLELTNNLNLLPLVMLVLLFAKAVGDSTGVEAIYDVHVNLKRLPFLSSEPPQCARQLTAGDAATPCPVSFQRVTPVRAIIAALESCDHNGFPVFSGPASASGSPSPPGEEEWEPSSAEEKLLLQQQRNELLGLDQKQHQQHNNSNNQEEFMGLILRSQILTLLRDRRALQSSPRISEPPSDLLTALSKGECAATGGGGLKGKEKDLRAITAALTPTELDSYLDLGPYCNPSTSVVQEGASLSKAYAQFRQLGSRHLVVIPNPSRVAGILTRKDLLPSTLSRRFPELSPEEIQDAAGHPQVRPQGGHRSGCFTAASFDTSSSSSSLAPEGGGGGRGQTSSGAVQRKQVLVEKL